MLLEKGLKNTSNASVACVQATAIALPLSKPLIMGGTLHERSISLLVRVITRDGAEGWGEASPQVVLHDRLSEMLSDVRMQIAPILVGVRLAERMAVMIHLGQTGRFSWRTLAAVEMALADAFARSLGIRVADLYGGPVRSQFEQKWLIGTGTLEGDLAEAVTRHKEGISFFILKVGGKSIDDDVRVARLMRETLGPDVRLVADANGCWTPDQALQFLSQTAEVGLECLEQPVAPDDIDGTARVVAASITPISIDEGICQAADIKHTFSARAIGGATIKVSKFGGLARAIQSGTLCHLLGLNTALATPMAETSIATAATLQVGAVLPGLEWQVAPSSDYLAEDIVENPIRHERGILKLPIEAGLGVTIDEQRLRDCRFEP